MFHCAVNFVAIANVADTDVPAVNDGIILVQNGHHVPPVDMSLIAIWSSAVTLLRTKLVSPKIRQIAPSSICPIDVSLLPPNDPNFVDYRPSPLVLRRQEEIAYQSTDSAAGPNNHYIVSALQVSYEPAPIGDIITIRGTGTTTLVASTWTNVPITWDTLLPQGTYAVIGCRVLSATGIAFQITFDNQFYRPGFLCGASAGIRPPWPQLKGGFGLWGRFNTVTLPRFAVLANAADTAQIVEMDIVRIG